MSNVSKQIDCFEVVQHLNFLMGTAVKLLFEYRESASPLNDLHDANKLIDRQLNEMPDFLELPAPTRFEMVRLLSECKFNHPQREAITDILIAHQFNARIESKQIKFNLATAKCLIDELIQHEKDKA